MYLITLYREIVIIFIMRKPMKRDCRDRKDFHKMVYVTFPQNITKFTIDKGDLQKRTCRFSSPILIF